jgi:hypothetical protein
MWICLACFAKRKVSVAFPEKIWDKAYFQALFLTCRCSGVVSIPVDQCFGEWR